MQTTNPVKNIHWLGTHHTFDGAVPVHFSFDNLPEGWSIDVTGRLDRALFEFVPKKQPSLTLTINRDETLGADAYTIDTRKDTIAVGARNPRGVLYALTTLNDITRLNGYPGQLPIMRVEDEPSIARRGIIEGYYGPPWTFDERMEMLEFMAKKRLNTYMYGPKSDPWHREKWSDPYPDEWIRSFKRLNEAAKHHHIDMYYTISPGYIKEGDYAFDYTNDRDFERLFKKMDQMREAGFTHFGLLMDDIDFNLNDKNKAIFKRPGIAHAYICNRLHDHLMDQNDAMDFVMCPTEYHEIGATPYRTDLKEHLHPDIAVFFTGDNVCAETIKKEDLTKTREAFDKRLYIWDNFPVSDFTHGKREFLAPVANRHHRMGDHVDAYMINPSIHYHISKVGMWTMADYAWDSEGYDPAFSFDRALRQFGEAFYRAQPGFVSYNYPNVMSHRPNPEHIRLAEENDTETIKTIADKLGESARGLLALDLPIIGELRPWLLRADKEAQLIRDVSEGKADHDDMVRFFSDTERLGSVLLERLVKHRGLLTDDEEKSLIDKAHEATWYRIFEEDRHS
jgi:hyaluronoglucosaminidase